MSQRVMLSTTTGEVYQPVRLHYMVSNPEQLKQCFEKLRCFGFDQQGQRWCWEYDAEARHLKFKIPRGQVQSPGNPIVLGSFRIRGNGNADLDVRSIERAIQAIQFFDKYIPRDVATLTELSVVNRLFSAEDIALTPDAIFDKTPAQRPNVSSFSGLRAKRMKTMSQAKRFRIWQERMDEESRRPVPEVELLPTHFYEDGIVPLEMSLQLRQAVALEHWNGNVHVTMLDLIRRRLGLPETPVPPVRKPPLAHRIDWNFASDIPSLDFFEGIDLASQGGLAEAIDRFVSDLNENGFRQWESVIRVEQNLRLAPIHERLNGELLDFPDEGDEEDNRVLYINEIARPTQPWYEVLRQIAPRLLVEPLVTSEAYDDFVDDGWFQIAVAIENGSRGLSLPTGVCRPMDVLPAELRHKLWLQHCCALLLGLGQAAELTLESESEHWRIDQCVQRLIQNRDSVAFLGLTLSGLLERCLLPLRDRAIFVRLLSERLALPGPDAPLADRLGIGPVTHTPIERVSPDVIRQAILHSEAYARYLAAGYFADEFSVDPAIARLIIQSIDQFGWESLGPHTGRLLADCVQSADTMAWLLARLQKLIAADGADEEAGDLAEALVRGDLAFLTQHRSAVDDLLRQLDPQMCEIIAIRQRHRDADLDSVWSSMLEILNGPARGELDDWESLGTLEAARRLANDPRMAKWITETLDRTIDQPDYDARKEELAIALAGRLQCQPAIPLLMEYLYEDDDPCPDAMRALGQIGGDEVVAAVLRKSATASARFLANAVRVLQDIHTPLSAATLLDWQSKTRDETVRERALSALLSGFVPAALEPARRQVRSSKSDVGKLRWQVVAVSLVTGFRSPESDQWRELAGADFISDMTDDDDFEDEFEDDLKLSDESDWDHDDEAGMGVASPGDVRLWDRRSPELDDPLLGPGSFGLESHRSEPIGRERAKVGRNDPCPCGSGKKYKKCCLNHE